MRGRIRHHHRRQPSSDLSDGDFSEEEEATSSETMKCVSCKEEYGSDDAGTCRECYEEASETEEELKREIEELKSKVNFLRFWSPLDCRPNQYQRSTTPCFTDVVLVASDDVSGKPAANPVPVPAHKAVLVYDWVGISDILNGTSTLKDVYDHRDLDFAKYVRDIFAVKYFEYKGMVYDPHLQRCIDLKKLDKEDADLVRTEIKKLVKTKGKEGNTLFALKAIFEKNQEAFKKLGLPDLESIPEKATLVSPDESDSSSKSSSSSLPPEPTSSEETPATGDAPTSREDTSKETGASQGGSTSEGKPVASCGSEGNSNGNGDNNNNKDGDKDNTGPNINNDDDDDDDDDSSDDDQGISSFYERYKKSKNLSLVTPPEITAPPGIRALMNMTEPIRVDIAASTLKIPAGRADRSGVKKFLTLNTMVDSDQRDVCFGTIIMTLTEMGILNPTESVDEEPNDFGQITDNAITFFKPLARSMVLVTVHAVSQGHIRETPPWYESYCAVRGNFLNQSNFLRIIQVIAYSPNFAAAVRIIKLAELRQENNVLKYRLMRLSTPSLIKRAIYLMPHPEIFKRMDKTALAEYRIFDEGGIAAQVASGPLKVHCLGTVHPYLGDKIPGSVTIGQLMPLESAPYHEPTIRQAYTILELNDQVPNRWYQGIKARMTQTAADLEFRSIARAVLAQQKEQVSAAVPDEVVRARPADEANNAEQVEDAIDGQPFPSI